MTIRQELSKIIGYTFTNNKFSESFKTLQIEGRVSVKQMLEILALLLEREAEREDDL